MDEPLLSSGSAAETERALRRAASAATAAATGAAASPRRRSSLLRSHTQGRRVEDALKTAVSNVLTRASKVDEENGGGSGADDGSRESPHALRWRKAVRGRRAAAPPFRISRKDQRP
jgi:hypothetical protein